MAERAAQSYIKLQG